MANGLAERCDLSQRHFTRSFREAVGLAPKAWCRVHRFGRALERLAADPALFLADVADGEGYPDQAHLPRAFRALAGPPPGAFQIGSASVRERMGTSLRTQVAAGSIK